MKMLKSHKEICLTFRRIKFLALKQGKGFVFDNCFYDSIKTKYGNESIGEILKNDNTSGCCYFYALLLAYAMEGSCLKTGVLHRLDLNKNDAYYEEFGHAWVECGNFVFDTTAKQVFLKDFYKTNFMVEERKVFDHSHLQNKENFLNFASFAVKNRPELLARFFENDKENETKKLFYDESLSKKTRNR